MTSPLKASLTGPMQVPAKRPARRVDSGPDAVPLALLRAREIVQPALEQAVGRLSPPLARIAGYHLGWLSGDGAPMPPRGGKRLRPALALLGAQAAGGTPADGLPAAVAVELVHNFSLLHDDIMDGDRERHHRPTAWTLFGPAQAILAGDALVVLAGQVLGELTRPAAADAARRLGVASQLLIDGQMADLAFEQRMDVELVECLDMAAGKTAALLEAAVSLGAVLAGAPGAMVNSLACFGRELGMAFQLVDDLLGIWGAPEVTGKPVLSDLRARKKSVPVCAAMAAGGTSAARLRTLIAGDGVLDGEELVLAAKLVEDAGGREWTTREADRRLHEALSALEGATLPDDVRSELIEVAHFVTTRAA